MCEGYHTVLKSFVLFVCFPHIALMCGGQGGLMLQVRNETSDPGYMFVLLIGISLPSFMSYSTRPGDLKLSGELHP